MISRNLLRIALVCASVSVAATAFAGAASGAAKGSGTPQNHHCQQADGTMDMGKTKKACLADKGKWVKDAASAPAASASAGGKK